MFTYGRVMVVLAVVLTLMAFALGSRSCSRSGVPDTGKPAPTATVSPTAPGPAGSGTAVTPASGDDSSYARDKIGSFPKFSAVVLVLALVVLFMYIATGDPAKEIRLLWIMVGLVTLYALPHLWNTLMYGWQAVWGQNAVFNIFSALLIISIIFFFMGRGGKWTPWIFGIALLANLAYNGYQVFWPAQPFITYTQSTIELYNRKAQIQRLTDQMYLIQNGTPLYPVPTDPKPDYTKLEDVVKADKDMKVLFLEQINIPEQYILLYKVKLEDENGRFSTGKIKLVDPLDLKDAPPPEPAPQQVADDKPAGRKPEDKKPASADTRGPNIPRIDINPDRECIYTLTVSTEEWDTKKPEPSTIKLWFSKKVPNPESDQPFEAVGTLRSKHSIDLGRLEKGVYFYTIKAWDAEGHQSHTPMLRYEVVSEATPVQSAPVERVPRRKVPAVDRSDDSRMAQAASGGLRNIASDHVRLSGLEARRYHDVYLEEGPQQIVVEIWRRGEFKNSYTLVRGDRSSKLFRIIDGDELRVRPAPSPSNMFTLNLVPTGTF